MGMQNPQEAIQSFSKAKVLVVGDIMLDRYTFGEVERVSPEAPIPVVRKLSEASTLGGAANVANNLATLGAKVWIAGVIGRDAAGATVKALLDEKRIGTEAVLVSPDRPTTEKHRIVSGDSQQLVRLDTEGTNALAYKEENALYERIAPIVRASDAVIFSDYAKGSLSEAFAQKILNLARSAGKITLADFKPKNKAFFRGADVISPNMKEAREMTGLDAVEEIGAALNKEFGAHVILTRGGEGMSVFRREDGSHHLVPGKKITVFDVSGAGDTAIALLALGLSAGLDILGAAALANEGSAIVVQKPRTATLTQEELSAVLAGERHIDNVEIVPKIWGYEKWLENNDNYCCKILSLNKGFQCSLHYHKNKDETFLVTSGHVRLEAGGEISYLRAGSFVRIPPNTLHRFAGIQDSIIVEVSTHHEESDSYRVEESRKMDETPKTATQPRRER